MEKYDSGMDLSSAAEYTPNLPPPQIPSWYFELPEYEEYLKELEKLPTYPQFQEQLDNLRLPGKKLDEAALNSALYALQASETPETDAAFDRFHAAVLKKYPSNKKHAFGELATLARKRYGDAENAIVRYVADNKDFFFPKDAVAAEIVHKAARDGDYEGLVKALEDGAYVDAKDSRGRTALFAACAYGKVPCVDILLEAGSVVNTRDVNNDTPLHYASQYGREKCAALLLAHGADVTCKNNEGKTPMDHENAIVRNAVAAQIVHKAARDGDYEGLVKALEDGAYVDAKDIMGRTALFAACAYGKVPCVEILLAAGSVVNTRDVKNDTPLHYASRYGREKCAALLLAHGADVTCKNNEGKTPLDYTVHDESLIEIRKRFQQLALSNQSLIWW